MEILQLCNDLALKPGEDKAHELNSYLNNLSAVCEKECGLVSKDTNSRSGMGTSRNSLLTNTSEMTLGELSKKNE